MSDELIEEEEYEGAKRGFSFDARSLAWDKCPRCKGKGSVEEIKPNGSTGYLWCSCVIMNQKRAAAEIRIQEAFPGRMSRMTFATYNHHDNALNKRALTVSKNFVDNWEEARAEGWIIGLYGEPGAGKTHLASAIGIACVKRYLITPYILSIPRMLELQRQTFRAELEDKLSPLDLAIQADLLILDDLGAEYVKNKGQGQVTWAEDFLYQILDERIKNDRPIVYTTNYSKSGMKDNIPPRIYDRIARNQVIEPQEVIKITTESRVNYKSKNKLSEERDDI